MKALLLTNYYLVNRSMLMYILISILMGSILLTFGDVSFRSMTTVLMLILISVPSLEIMKHEGKSGFDKFVLTLPINRKTVVKSHYLFYLIIITIGVLVSVSVLYGHAWTASEPLSPRHLIGFLSPSVGLMLFLGATMFPLLFRLSYEKSDGILLFAALFSMFVSVGLERLLNRVWDASILIQDFINLSIFIPLTTVILGILLFLISFLISIRVYQNKNF